MDFAVHHAEVAVEHLLKAYLATHNPALVAGDLAMTLVATGTTEQLHDRRQLSFPGRSIDACPACNGGGFLVGPGRLVVRVRPLRIQAEEELTAEKFHCYLCDLSLQGEEIPHSGLPQETAFERRDLGFAEDSLRTLVAQYETDKLVFTDPSIFDLTG